MIHGTNMVQECTKFPKREIRNKLAGDSAEVVDIFTDFVIFISLVILSLFSDYSSSSANYFYYL